MEYQKIAFLLKDIPETDAILLVGLERKKEAKSIDLLIICKNGDIRNYAEVIIDKMRGKWIGGNFSVCDDSVRFLISGITGGVAVYDTAKLETKVRGWVNGDNLNGEHRPWAIGYWIPEALCGDIVTARSLYDRVGIYRHLREMLMPYPLSLSLSIRKLCRDEIDQKIEAIFSLSKKQVFETGLIVSDISTTAIRFAFGRSKVYLRGFKDIKNQLGSLALSDNLLVKMVEGLSKIKTDNNHKLLLKLISEIGRLI